MERASIDSADTGLKNPSRKINRQRLEIERRIFELQELLVNPVPTELPDILRECQLIFQPRHYEEVLEERSYQGFCGNPACENPIGKVPTHSTVRISYRDRRLYEVDKSTRFCSSGLSAKCTTLRGSFRRKRS
jgi:Rtr1/RPAP2 family